MRKYLRGPGKALAIVEGLVVPGLMIVALLLAPLWGWQATYGVLKVAAFFFVVAAAFWYLADDADRLQDEDDGDDSRQAGAYIKDPPVHPLKEENISAAVTAAKESVAGITYGGGRRASDRVQNLPEAAREAEEEPAPQTYVFRGEVGGSEGLKERGLPRESVLPGDAKLFREYDGWALYTSASKNAIFVRTTDYHPKPLRLTEEMLSDFLQSLRPEGRDHLEPVSGDNPGEKKPDEDR